LRSSERGDRVAKKPGVQQTKKEKRDLHIEPASVGMSRRRFLTFLGTGSAALLAGSSGILTGCAKSEVEAAGAHADGEELFFEPIEPSDADELVLPEGFKYDIIRKWGDPVTQDRDYGYNNDFVAYFPIDALEGGENSQDGLLWVNHEYPIALFVSDYTDPDSETKKTPEQISKEKAATGGSLFRVKKEGDAWKFVESEEYNRRIDATTPMEVTGPAAGSEEMRMQGKSKALSTIAAGALPSGTPFLPARRTSNTTMGNPPTRYRRGRRWPRPTAGSTIPTVPSLPSTTAG
jgi:secreted PhoX family phosphatase